MCSVCSAALEAFGAARTLSAPIQHAKSEEVGYRPSGPWDNDWCVSCMTILTGDMLATQRGVWEGWNTVQALFFYALHSVISCFHVEPPAYCISRKRRTYTLLWSWQHVETVRSMQLFCRRIRQKATKWSEKGSWLFV